MSKKGFFNFLKGWVSISEEEKGSPTTAAPSIENKSRPERKQHIATEEMQDYAVKTFETMLQLAGFSGKVRGKKRENHKIFLEVYDTDDDAGRIIGKGGSTLESFQTLLRHFIIRKFSVPVRIMIDAADYRSKRFLQLKDKALKAAEEVKATGDELELDPMNSAERRSIHLLFENDTTIRTFSEGEGSLRKVVLAKR
jgi:predicted RNA-binding protein Jag